MHFSRDSVVLPRRSHYNCRRKSPRNRLSGRRRWCSCGEMTSCCSDMRVRGRGRDTHTNKQTKGMYKPMPHPSFGNLPFGVHAQYDWPTGVPDDGNEWRKFRVVPRSHPLCPLLCTLFNRVGNRRAFRLPEEGGIISIVRWNLCLVIFVVELSDFFLFDF